MSRELGVVMDPIHAIKPEKDTTLALLLAAAGRGWNLHYMEPDDLWLRDGRAFASLRSLEVADDADSWYQLGEPREAPLDELDVVLMRQDPPFDMEYVYTTYILERARDAGVAVINDPAALRDANEKVFTAWFPELAPPTLISRNAGAIRAFAEEHGDIIIKPLDGMGGRGIFRLTPDDPNLSVAIETLLEGGRTAMAQTWLPAIGAGDKRIILIDGAPVPWLLARMPAPGETRANLAVGGHGEARALTTAENELAWQVGPELCRRGLRFVGLDVIGDRITEINVTSPTGIREIEAASGIDVGGRLMDAIAESLA
ncbi:glutathione synthase [Thiohalospira halophila DSM 15071]|uniref:Glutathione synthetase n=1 Tax=Thiohalospira halophila DSM 15071 TaxID=1123397 RepID=A0A1I1SGH1_9GAMM|nr:glutathione synthase [Thiohalospira halophila]SFD45557.1 glutathione synthase [Thiohalospira halophila DSM 15071]